MSTPAASRLLICDLEPSARTWALAAAIAPELPVTLVVAPERSESIRPGIPGLEVVSCDAAGAALRANLTTHDVVMLRGLAARHHPFLLDTERPIVLDLGPIPVLEALERDARRPPDGRRSDFAEQLRIVNDHLRRADLVVCGSEGQRNLVLGMLLALHRVNPDTWAADPSLRALIDVVAPEPLAAAPDAAVATLVAFCRRPRRAPDAGLYVTDAERVAADRGVAIEALLEFNYWHQSSTARGEVIAGLEREVAVWRAIAEERRGQPAVLEAGETSASQRLRRAARGWLRSGFARYRRT